MNAYWRTIEEMSITARMDLFGVVPFTDMEGTCRPIILHTREYIKVRDSFYGSKEWKDFRDFFLQLFPTCGKCGKPADTVHHKAQYAIDLTLVKEGLLKPLKDFTRFESLCHDCHYKSHKSLINWEVQE